MIYVCNYARNGGEHKEKEHCGTEEAEMFQNNSKQRRDSFVPQNYIKF